MALSAPEFTYVGEHHRQAEFNAESGVTRESYRSSIAELARLGSRIIRLDAFACLHKAAERR